MNDTVRDVLRATLQRLEDQEENQERHVASLEKELVEARGHLAYTRSSKKDILETLGEQARALA